MSNGIADLLGDATSPDPEEEKRRRLWQLMAERRDAPESTAGLPSLLPDRHRYGPSVDDPRLEELQPLLDSLQTLLPPPPRRRFPLANSLAGRAFPKLGISYGREPGYEETVPVSFRAEGPESTWGMYSSPPPSGGWWSRAGRDPEQIDIFPSAADERYPMGVADQTDEDLRHTAIHEFGHAYDYRDPEAETGWMSPELREAIYSAEAPFDVAGRYGTDKPGQRYADLVADAIGFLQTSKDPKIDPDYTRRYLEDRPYIGSIVEELLQTPIYQEHPLNIGSLGSDYVPPDEALREWQYGGVKPEWALAAERQGKVIFRSPTGSLGVEEGPYPYSRFGERWRQDQ